MDFVEISQTLGHSKENKCLCCWKKNTVLLVLLIDVHEWMLLQLELEDFSLAFHYGDAEMSLLQSSKTKVGKI